MGASGVARQCRAPESRAPDASCRWMITPAAAVHDEPQGARRGSDRHFPRAASLALFAPNSASHQHRDPDRHAEQPRTPVRTDVARSTRTHSVHSPVTGSRDAHRPRRRAAGGASRRPSPPTRRSASRSYFARRDTPSCQLRTANGQRTSLSAWTSAAPARCTIETARHERRPRASTASIADSGSIASALRSSPSHRTISPAPPAANRRRISSGSSAGCRSPRPPARRTPLKHHRSADRRPPRTHREPRRRSSALVSSRPLPTSWCRDVARYAPLGTARSVHR